MKRGVIVSTKTRNNKQTGKKSVGIYVLGISLVAVLFCALIGLLLVRDSADYATKQIALDYYESIVKDDSEQMKELLYDKDVAKLVNVTTDFDKYFKSITDTILSQYGEGFMVTLENFEYTDFDETVKKRYETAYDVKIAQAGLIGFDITFASAPTAKLDGGTESVTQNTFRDNLVMIKIDGDWYPATSIGLENGLSQRYLTALEVGDIRVSIAEYNFFYNLLSSGLEEGQTLSDGEALSYVTEVYTMYAAAQKEGFKPDEKDVEEMEKQLEEIKKKAQSYGDDAEMYYYTGNYGYGMTADLLYDVYYAHLVMQSYIAKISDDTDPTNTEIEDYYNKHKDMFDTVDFVFYEIYSGVEGSLSDATDRASQVLANSNSVEEFKAQCELIYNGLSEDEKKLNLYQKEAVFGENYTYYDFQDVAKEFRDWVFSEGRVEGDKKYFAVDSGDEDIGYIVAMAYMISPRHRAEYNTVNFSYATVLKEAGSEQEILDRLTKAKDDWMAGDRTSESFEELADSFYESENKNEDGGSYIQIAKGDMIDEIDVWIFDESRVKGDCAIIKSENGYHLLYFAGEDIVKWQLDVKAQIRYDAVSKIYEDTSRSEGLDVLGINVVMYC
ncbi:MAG: peptidylprolyl isomerase [Clostridia bacterium]|nr:peptidylprolyl isomerase [Clostridia bacterium]